MPGNGPMRNDMNNTRPADLSSATLQQAPAACLLVDPDTGKILAANTAACQLLGYTDIDLQKKTCRELICAFDASQADTLCRILHRHPDQPADMMVHLETSTHVSVPVSLFACPQGTDMMIFLMVQKDDPTDFDPVTGLYWMRSFLREADRKRKNCPAGSFLYINLIHFKRYNITHGMEAGDHFLHACADILRVCFPEALLCRLAADHFAVCTDCRNPEAVTAEVRDRILAIAPGTGIECKCGICAYEDSTVTSSAVLDCAQSACASIHDDTAKYVCTWSHDVLDKEDMRQYIIEHLDHAIAAGEILICYQPVVRTLTGALCGFEALARWNSPRYGFLTPGLFIPVLEESRLIHKLDCHVVEEVCRKLREEQDLGHPTVPVSFNLSRLDFTLCDIFAAVENTVARYSLPRDMVHIEVTESTVISDRKHMAEEIARFRNAGYQVWMDDFGSGYSSLNVLKDYQFDELKIDMEFLRSFSLTSRSIVASAISMAKDIHTHTLAEGVETKEQAAFLRSAGCEKIQGYYCGKPLPYDQSMAHCRKEHLRAEPRAWRHYYDEIGIHRFSADAKTCVLEQRNSHLRILFMNETCRKFLISLGYSVDEDGRMDEADFDPILYARLSSFLDSCGWEKENDTPHVMQAVDHGHDLSFTIQCIASCPDASAFQLTIHDLTGRRREKASRDQVLRNLYMQFDNAYILNLEEDWIDAMNQDEFFHESPQHHYPHIQAQFDAYCDAMIYPNDQERFRAYIRTDTLAERILHSKLKILISQFRVRQKNGEYIWKSFGSSLAAETNGRYILIAARKSAVNSDPHTAALYEQFCRMADNTPPETITMAPAVLWRSLMALSPFICFWKDRDLKYEGVSRAFLKAFGIREEKTVLHHTDEEIGWNIQDQYHRDAEKELLVSGINQKSTAVRLIHGRPCSLTLCEIPVYHAGRIIGLMGIILTEEDRRKISGDRNRVGIDPASGLPNAENTLNELLLINSRETMEKIRPEITLVTLPAYRNILHAYGPETARAMLKTCAVHMSACLGTSGFIGRLSDAAFLIIRSETKPDARRQLCDDIRASLSDIHEISGMPVTVRPYFDPVSSLYDLLQKPAFLRTFVHR